MNEISDKDLEFLKKIIDEEINKENIVVIRIKKSLKSKLLKPNPIKQNPIKKNNLSFVNIYELYENINRKEKKKRKINKNSKGIKNTIKNDIKKSLDRNTGFDIDFYQIYDWFGFTVNDDLCKIRKDVVQFLLNGISGMRHGCNNKIEHNYKNDHYILYRRNICGKYIDTPFFSNIGFKILAYTYPHYRNKSHIVKYIGELNWQNQFTNSISKSNWRNQYKR